MIYAPGIVVGNMGDKMERRAIDVAKYATTKCYMDKRPLSNLQLNRLLYYLQISYYKNFGKFLFPDDFEAALFGPIVKTVYLRFCGAGAYDLCLKFPESMDMWEPEEKRFIDKIINERIDEPPWNLVNDISGEGKAWADTFGKDNSGEGIISKKLIVKC